MFYKIASVTDQKVAWKFLKTLEHLKIQIRYLGISAILRTHNIRTLDEQLR